VRAGLRRTLSARGWRILGTVLAALVAAHLLDPWAQQHLRMDGVYERDWGRLLRVLGYAPTWLLIAALFWLEGRTRDPADGAAGTSTARAVVLAMIVGGLGSELLKLLIRRERPVDGGTEYLFRSFGDAPLSTRRLGMPSGHTMVAFAGAAALAQRFPRAAPVLFAAAAGCGLTRVLAQAHYLSDVVAAGIGGTASGWWAARPANRGGK
jgi:membrane-associated phospholipid phosphatase